MEASRFHLGRWEDDGTPVLYDPADLTTHGVVIGMTGSGKTGLLITLLEEAARAGIPAIVIDPKGDLTNLLLHFPELRGSDFSPWIDPESGRRHGKTVEALAQETADQWRQGLAEWGLDRDALLALQDAVAYRVFTPGSTAGTPVNLLSSFASPQAASDEAQQEQISSVVTALLGLVGMQNVDPLRSREHILLSNIFANAWARGQSFDLASLIEQVQAPPFDRLGAFPLERFFPEKDRFALALLLNNFLAAPSFSVWLEGQSLDAGELLYTPQGKPRFSIFYLAHLDESERMFFVTLLLAAVEGWMRSQRGTSSLRALLAFDEIVGYLPPVANPPSRAVLLRLLKQGRAFGLGVLLATQNPTDLNYKALSNAGTWFIGRLQTERDKDRLLDGLQSLESGIDRARFDRMIAGLQRRLFLLHNVHRGTPRIFRTRWTLNYLAGPLTRAQIPNLPGARALLEPPALVDVQAVEPASNAAIAASTMVGRQQKKAPVPQASSAHTEDLVSAPPQIPTGTNAYYFPVLLSFQRALAAVGSAFRGPLEPLGLAYRPGLLFQAAVGFHTRRYMLADTLRVACLLPLPQPRPDWDLYARPPFDPAHLNASLSAPGKYLPLPPLWASNRALASYQRMFLDWVHRTASFSILTNEPLGLNAQPEESEAEFRSRVNRAMHVSAQAELDKLEAKYQPRIQALARRIERQALMVDRRSQAVEQRQAEQKATDFDFVAGLFTKRKRSVSNSIARRRMTGKARGEYEDARKVLEGLRSDYQALDRERQELMQRVVNDWQTRAAQITAVEIHPLKKDIYLELFGIAWLPHYLVQSPDGLIEAPAF